MFKTDLRILVEIPYDSEEAERVLHPGVVTGSGEDVYTASFKELQLDVSSDDELVIFYEKDRVFVRQLTRVAEVLQDEEIPNFELEPVGDAIPAENRQFYRVSCISADITSDFGSESACDVLDVSATGFSVYAKKAYTKGARIEASLKFGEIDVSGPVEIQSVRRMFAGKMRYGVHCIDVPGSTLKSELGRINLEIQREQARRMSGADL